MVRHWFAKGRERRRRRREAGLLVRLRRDVRGNTLAIAAASMLPLAALAGSAVDMARLYTVKARLQQACDAGVLAGRKFMDDSGSKKLDQNATAQAQQFFTNNFTEGWLNTDDVAFTPVKTADSQVSGTARTTVPMTIMRMFNASAVPIEVTCEARFDVADADIMFVLDTTGSMACAPADTAGCSQNNLSYVKSDGTTGYYVQEKSNSKLDALRDAVIDFDTTMRTNADPSTQIRYGFVTYSSSVNVGKLLDTQHLVGEWNYNSRRLYGEVNDGNATLGLAITLTDGSTCASANRRYPGADATDRSGWFSNSTAYYIRNAKLIGLLCIGERQNVRPLWRYERFAQDVRAFKTGSAVVDPTRLDGRTSQWSGCIEERQTSPDSSFDIDALPADLDPDLIPSSDATRWKPLWSDVTWDRRYAGNEDSSETDATRANSNYRPYGEAYLQSRGFAPCGTPARRLAVMSAGDVQNYVRGNDFRALGGTYHDVGMIWGVRMLSPKGIFAADTAARPGRNAPTRHVVFMTDGQMAPNADIYGQYGIEAFDGRVGGGTTNVTTLTTRHTARFLAVCNYARQRLNMTVWVVALGTSLGNDLEQCAGDTTRTFVATDKAALSSAFKTIATQVAMLRLSN